MRIDARGIYRESGFILDFTAAAHGSIIHDKAAPEDGNTFWDGVDFRILEADHEVWIEIKSWSFKQIRDRAERHAAKRNYSQKFGTLSEEFRDKIFHKFLGTSAYLAWGNIALPNKVTYVVFLEPPDPGSLPLLQPFQDLLRERFKNMPEDFKRRISFRVVTVREFQTLYPQYPVSRA